MVSQYQPQRNGPKQVKPIGTGRTKQKPLYWDASTFQGSEIPTGEKIAPTEDELTIQNENP